MSEMSHLMLSIDMKYPLEKVQHCCHIIDAVLERKEKDENAHDFISKMVTEQEECRAFLRNARSLLSSIGSGPSHVDADSPFVDLIVEEIELGNGWSTSPTVKPEVFTTGRPVTLSPDTYSTPDYPWHLAAADEVWHDVPDSFTVPPKEQRMVKERGVVGLHQGQGGVVCNNKILIDNRYSDNFLLRKCNTIVV